MRESILEKFDYLLFLCVFILVFMGIAFIYSSGVNSSGVLMTNEHIKQIIWGIIGLVFLVFFAIYYYFSFEHSDYIKSERKLKLNKVNKKHKKKKK